MKKRDEFYNGYQAIPGFLEKVEKAYRVIEKLKIEHNLKIIQIYLTGSYASGLYTEDSDVDLVFIYSSPLERYLELNNEERSFSCIDKQEGYDVKGIGVRKFLQDLSKSKAYTVELMHSIGFTGGVS